MSGEPVVVRRLPNGPIDFDHYRTHAVLLRGQAKRDARLLRWACSVVVAVTVAFLVLLFLTAARTYAPHGETVFIKTGEPRFE
jgi:hypothetical protein